MNLIQPTITPGESGSHVSNLQDALLFLLEQKKPPVFQALPPPDRPTADDLASLKQTLRTEQSAGQFGGATMQLVSLFQHQQGLGDHLEGKVEATTAKKLNEFLKQRGALDGDRTFAVKGRVLRAEIVQPDVLVRVFAVDATGETVLGESQTNSSGIYRVEFLASLMQASPDGAATDKAIVARAYRPDGSEMGAAQWAGAVEALTVLDVVVEPDEYLVQGRITDSQGRPQPGLKVVAYDQDLRYRQRLGDAPTDADGRYTIRYRREQFEKGEGQQPFAPDLVVEVLPDDNLAPLATSDRRHHAKPVEVIDLTVPAREPGPSEFERITAAVMPLLAGQGKEIQDDAGPTRREDLPPYELRADDVEFIVAETSLDSAAVQAWAQSARMAMELMHETAEPLPAIGPEGLSPDQLIGFGWEAFYGFVRNAQAADLDEILRHDSETWASWQQNNQESGWVRNIHDRQWLSIVHALERLRKLRAFDQVRFPDNPLASVASTMEVPLPRKLAERATDIFLRQGFNDPEAFFAMTNGPIDANTDEAAATRRWVRMVRLHGLTDGDLGLMRELHQQIDGDGHGIERLAAAPLADWRGWCEASTRLGDDDSKVRLPFRMQANAELQYPMVALGARIEPIAEHLPPSAAPELRRAVTDHPDGMTRLMAGELNHASVSAMPETARDLGLNLGRFLRLGVTLETGARLWTAGAKTPAQMVGLGPAVIQKLLGEAVPTAYIMPIITQAQTLLTSTQALFNQIVSMRTMPLGLGATQTAISGEVQEAFPTVRGFFGDLDQCVCPPCESVLGLPAYLVDLLNFIRQIPAHKINVVTALDELRARRPDILNLPLGCLEAETEIQHIDIVIKILQGAIGTSADLATQAYPWSLPYVQEAVETRAWLDRLPMQRTGWMTQMQGLLSDPEFRVGLAAEQLGLSRIRDTGGAVKGTWPLVASAVSGDSLWQLYGFANSLSTDVRDPASGETRRGEPLSLLSIVSILLDRTGLGLDSLRQALAAHFITEGATIRIINLDHCKTSEMHVMGLTEPILDRLHRFVRLWRARPGWSIPVLDSGLRACRAAAAEPFANVLIRLGRVVAIHERLNLPMEEVLSLFHPLHEISVPSKKPGLDESLYEAIFRSDRLSEKQKALMPALPSAPGTPPTFPIAQTLVSRVPVLALGMKCPPKDLARWIHTGTAASPGYLVSNAFDYATVTALYRRHRLAKALSLSPEELSLLLFMTGTEAYSAGVTAFCDAMDMLLDAHETYRLSGLTMEETARLLLSDTQWQGVPRPTVLEPDWGDIKRLLVSLRIALLQLQPPTGDKQVLTAATEEALGAWVPAQALPNIIAALLGEQGADIAVAKRDLQVAVPGVPGAQGEPAMLFDQANVDAPFAGGTAEDRLGVLLLRTTRIRREALLRTELSQWSGLEELVLDQLLARDLRVEALNRAPRPAVVALLDEFQGGLLHKDHGLTHEAATQLPEFLDWVDQLKRTASLLSLLRVDDAVGLFTCLRPASVIGIGGPREFSWTTLLAPSRAPGGNPRWPEWRAVVSTIQMLRRGVLVETLSKQMQNLSASVPNIRSETLQPLARAWNITTENLLDLMNRIVPSSFSWRDPWHWWRAGSLLEQSLRLGASPAQVIQLVQATPTAATSDAAKALVLAKRSIEADIVTNDIKNLHRDALLASAIAQTSKTAEQLYEHYLIDVHMAPCMRTTPILQAIASVQQFVHRILFGLEPGIGSRPGADLADVRQQWKWMAQYRVWEANRKVFLYPENWLFPELRDDKSECFKALEAALGQSELTQEMAEEAFGAFLDEIAQTAQIRVLGMFEDVDSRQGSTNPRDLYVVGRTAYPPYTYFWRVCRGFGTSVMEWQPWSGIDVDVQGDHAMPFVLDRQLYIAWPLFNRPDPNTKRIQWEISIAWSRLTDKGWSRQETTRDVLSVNADPLVEERSGFSFRIVPAAIKDGMAIHVFAAQETGITTWQLPSDQVSRTPFSQGSQVTVNCQYAAKINDPRGNPIWVRLDPAQHAIELVDVDTGIRLPPFFRHPPGWLETWPSDFSFSLRATLTVGARKIESDTKSQSVNAKETANMTLIFRFEPSAGETPLTVADLGLANAPAQLHEMGRFLFTSTRVIRITGGSSSPLPPGVLNGRSWMNGVREQDTELSPLTLETSQGPISLLDRSDASKYWVLGAASSRTISQTPRVWYFEEEANCAYFDLGLNDPISTTSCRLIPAQHLDATNFPGAYRRGELPSSSTLKGGAFVGPQQLPALSRIVVKDLIAPSQAGDLLAFDSQLPYASYNWEVFFHAPLLVADRLSKQGRYWEAERWLRLVLDPTSGDSNTGAQRFLRFRPFRDIKPANNVSAALTALARAKRRFTAQGASAVRDLIIQWRLQPFMPFLIARQRPLAFLWRTVFAYLDNLLAWADDLFRLDTRESINEATQLYVLAATMLGPRPKTISGRAPRTPITYDQAQLQWDEFANVWLDATGSGAMGNRFNYTVGPSRQHPPADGSLGMLYFCIPVNPKLNGYWDLVEDRLFNIRHCRNIDGVTRDLPLTEAPIDPELLVRATAAGLDIADVLRGLYAPPHVYRSQTLLARALDLANETKALGAALLSALEKRDAERLALLRSTNEIALLQRVKEVRLLQITEAQESLAALGVSRENAKRRYEHFQRLLGKDGKAPEDNTTAPDEDMLSNPSGDVSGFRAGFGGLGLIEPELLHIEHLGHANRWMLVGGATKSIASFLHFGSATADAAGDPQKGRVLKAVGTGVATTGDIFDLVGRAWQQSSSWEQLRGSHIRRRDEWAHQSNQVLAELRHIDRQSLAQKIRLSIAEKERDNQHAQIEQARDVDEFLRKKFSNVDLYEWMRGELSNLHRNAYRTALDLARRAERAAAEELGIQPLNMIKNDYWGQRQVGLLAGERLHQDIKQLELYYLEQNKRELELTKHISLRRLNPEALLKLIFTGECHFDVPEWLFDMDTPGHYLRRIKTVSLSIPCVVGPQASIHCKLTLLGSETRKDKLPGAGDYPRKKETDDHRFTVRYGATESIVTSTGRDDSGLFETSLRDERYLPFEGAGAISRWKLELLDKEVPQFDHKTISDVIVHIRYTARDGGDGLQTAATNSITAIGATLGRPFHVLLSARHDFPMEWAKATTSSNDMEIPISHTLLPYWLQTRKLGITNIAVWNTQANTFQERGLPGPIGPGQSSSVSVGPVHALTDGDDLFIQLTIE